VPTDEPVSRQRSAIAVTTSWNFWMNKTFSWSVPQPLTAPFPA